MEVPMRWSEAGSGAWFWMMMASACARPAPPPSPAPPAPPPTAGAILEAMEQTYATAASYEDHGTVTTQFSGRSSHTDRLAFETAFVRGKRFRFEYHHDHELRGHLLGTDRYTIWSDFVHTYSDWTVRPGIIDDGSDLSLAVGVAAGVSSRSSITIPALLLPDVAGHGNGVALDAPRVAGVELLDGHPCWRLEGTSNADPLTLWIDRDTRVLRQVVSSHHFADFDTVSTMVFEPVLGRPVDDARVQPPDITTSPPVPRPPPAPQPWIGVMLAPGSTTIQHVERGTPADKAGLVVGDTIIAIDGRQTVSGAEVVAFVRLRGVGAQISVTVMRSGTPVDVSVTVADAMRPR